jgi:hypothetical protein
VDEHMPASKGEKASGRRSSTGIAFSADLATIGPDNNLRLTVTDERPGKKLGSWTVDVNCLLCHALIEKAAMDEPPAPETESKSKGKNKGNDKDTVISEAAESDATPSKVEEPADEPTIPSLATKSPDDLSSTVPLDLLPPKPGEPTAPPSPTPSN